MTRNALLIAAALLCGSSLAHAQSAPVTWGGGAYPPMMPMNPYPPMGFRPAQYPMAGFSQNPYGPPGMMPMVQPANPVYGYPNNNGYGINYYPAPSPQGFSPTPGPFHAVHNNRAIGKPVGWPIPAHAGDAEYNERLDGPTGYTDIRRPLPPVPFHRTPNESCFGSLEYVGMFFRPIKYSAPLVTTGSVLDAAPGALGQPGTSVLFGNNDTDFGLMSGLRAQIGMFLDADNHYSIEAGGFVIFQNTQGFNVAGDVNGRPSISRPLFNIATGAEGAFINSLQGMVTGTLNIDLRSELGGFEINARRHWYVNERMHIDGLLGFRYMRLAERMQIVENLQTIAPQFVTFRQIPIGVGATLIDDDLFETTNQFFGPQIGGRLSWEQNWFTLTGFAKLALGGTRQNTNIAGSTTVLSQTGAVAASAQGGILALPTNIGSHSRTVFGILPEFGLNLGVELTQSVRLNFGYSFMLWNHVVRPGSQFDRVINPALAPSTPPPIPVGGPQAPIYQFNDELFWAHAFNIGIEFHY